MNRTSTIHSYKLANFNAVFARLTETYNESDKIYFGNLEKRLFFKGAKKWYADITKSAIFFLNWLYINYLLVLLISLNKVHKDCLKTNGYKVLYLVVVVCFCVLRCFFSYCVLRDYIYIEPVFLYHNPRRNSFH